MREYNSQDGIVDLDNPETYARQSNSIYELTDKMYMEIGYAMMYMDYIHPNTYRKRKPKEENRLAMSGYNQRQRVNKLIKEFAKNKKTNWNNIMWFKEQVFLFEDETENMC